MKEFVSIEGWRFPFLNDFFKDIFTFLYYVNEASEIRNREDLENIAAVVSNLAKERYIKGDTD